MRPPPLLLCATAVLLGVVMSADTARAHARLESSTPSRAARLTEAPAAVEITFTQEIQRVSGTYDILVVKDRGASVTAGPAVVNDADRRILSVPLLPNLADGRYVVNWKNVSDADGDPAEGAFSFYLNHEPNSVDLENDDQLDQIGAEDETPAATAGAQTLPPASPTAASATDVPATAETSPTPGNDAEADDDNSTPWLIIAGVAVAALAVIGGGYMLTRGRN